MTTITNVIERDRLAEVLRGLPITMVSNLFVATSLAVSMWDSLPHAVLAAFIGCNTLVNAARVALAWVWQRRGLLDANPRRLLMWCWVGALLSGLCWAGILLACARHGQAYSVAVGLTFCGINAGATVQSKASRAQVLAFILPNSLLLVILFALAGSLAANTIAINLALLTALMIRSANDQERHFRLSSRLRHEADALTASLKAANVAAVQAVERLKHAATHDPLTGLMNRAGYQAAFEDRLAAAARDGGTFTLLLIDLDRFKSINDRYGHVVGDAVLVATAERLSRYAGPDAVIARLGGDEFAALVPVADREAAANLAQGIVAGLATLGMPSGQVIQAGASVGLAHCPRDGETARDLQTFADLALYAAKEGGRRSWREFDEAMRDETRMKRAIEADLAQALAGDAIGVWFQPQVDCWTGAVVGVEALLRWRHPRFGWVSPPRVVSAAQTTRQCEALTRAILRKACRMIALLDRSGHGDTVVSINVSPGEFGTYPVAELIATELAAGDLDPSRLAIEITEEAVYSTERGGADIAALTRLGVRVIVDDFGVAYSSIGSLRDLPLAGLKIDRSFIHGVADNTRDRLLTEAVLAFANTLGAHVVAEGVETREQVEVLRALGCQVLQGYYFAKAMPEAEALLWIGRNAGVAAMKRIAPPPMLRHA
ncbi:hypothetical protein ASF49_10530 [Methylobacterium sp. Leaf104]|uniref:putative bifunctional diguanylate cyclase/phosphodiesterase n=1 Tax=Methylobacterium TaxID=407 RepID=UPI0006FF411D|nr:EAL domain-containing protein [Methylobacterium sp. Leaf104]KQP31853.1 hypothetical protein ASF49_10530 [Methylobacterium sp. Leaf104]MCI9880785.1 EAL domain-containing protein [Methylobacterium goesingense]